MKLLGTFDATTEAYVAFNQHYGTLTITAPLLHLHSTDPYLPSSISAQLNHTHPTNNADPVSILSPPLTLDNLSQLNTLDTNSGKDIYLTSNDDITTSPKWLEGIRPDAHGGTGDEKTGVIVVVDKGSGVVDAFYFYFCAFNWGGVVLGKQLGKQTCSAVEF